METANSAKENALFNNISSTDTAKPAGFSNDNNNHFVSKLNGDGNAGSIRVGPSIVLKVMTGDTISISTYGWYKGIVQLPPGTAASLALELVPLILNGVGGQNGGKGGVVPTSFTDPALGSDIANFLSGSRPYDTLRPKAYLNWMVVGEDYAAATSSSNHVGAIQVPVCNTSDTSKLIVGPANMVIRRNGWIYIYLSNESAQNVYFDNLVINLRHGPLVEQKDYYPFGMENPALSTQAIKYKYSANRYDYNGKELQSKEFSDTSGLNWDDYGARMYDPIVGRWNVIDPLAEKNRKWTPYNYADDNPMRFIDPDGMDPLAPGANDNVKVLLEDAGSSNLPDLNKPNKPGGGEDKKNERDNRRRENRDSRRRWRDNNRRRVFNFSLFDERGNELLGRWLNGSGKPLTTMNGAWGKYMSDNKILERQIFEILKADAVSRTQSGQVNFTFHAEIENGYTTAYEMLHGTKSTMGDFQIQGTATRKDDRVIYNVVSTWNDIENPNPIYQDDMLFSNVLNLIYSPKDYEVHISWRQEYDVVLKKE